MTVQKDLTPEQFVAYMRGAVDFLPADGPDPIQWLCIKDMAMRVQLAVPKALPRPPCSCGPHHRQE